MPDFFSQQKELCILMVNIYTLNICCTALEITGAYC